MGTPTTPGFSSSTPPAQPPQGGAPEAQGQAPQGGVQNPAPPIMQLLGGWHRVAGEIGQHHPPIMAMMQKVASATQEALMILAREHTKRQQGQGLPTDQGAPSAQFTASPAGYPPSGY